MKNMPILVSETRFCFDVRTVFFHIRKKERQSNIPTERIQAARSAPPGFEHRPGAGPRQLKGFIGFVYMCFVVVVVFA